ncbi:MAG: P-II family nitrogen regulator [Georgfuchsia sp.]
MKVIKAFIHQYRAADTIQALKAAGGVSNLFVTTGQGTLVAMDAGEQHYSMDLGDTVIRECKLELLCEDDQVDALVAIVRENAQTGKRDAGWVYVTDVIQAIPVGTRE